MIFDRRLTPAGDHDDLIAARRQRFLDAILDSWLIHQRQHLIRLGFGGGKKTRTQPSRRKYCFANFHAHHWPIDRIEEKLSMPIRVPVQTVSQIRGRLLVVGWPQAS